LSSRTDNASRVIPAAGDADTDDPERGLQVVENNPAEGGVGDVADIALGDHAAGRRVHPAHDVADRAVVAIDQPDPAHIASGQLDGRRLPDAAARPRDHRDLGLDFHGKNLLRGLWGS
jgi:hypothetical protein